MKRTFTLLMIFAASCLGVAAEGLTATSCRLLRNNLQARTQQRFDKDSTKCALILVEVVGVKGLDFQEKVGDVKYAYNQYEVYVPAGTKTLTYGNGDVRGQVKLADDFGLDIEPLCTYRLDFKSANDLHSATFYVSPANATFKFEGKAVQLDDDGVACIEQAAGKYTFSAEAPGYEPTSGTIELKGDEANEVTEVALNQICHQVTLVCQPEATLFIDDKPYGKVGKLSSDFSLSEGKHHYRLTLENFKDAEGDIDVSSTNTILKAEMERMKDKVVKHSEERSRTTGTIRGYGTLELSGLTFANDMFKSYQIRLRGTGNTNFAGIFTWRYIDFGISAGIFEEGLESGFDTERPEDSTPINVEDAMQVGVMLPLSRYNHYLFTVLGGMYGGYWVYAKNNTEDNDDSSFEGGFFDYGFRLSAAFLLHKFVIGAEYNKSFRFGNVSSLGVTLGIKI